MIDLQKIRKNALYPLLDSFRRIQRGGPSRMDGKELAEREQAARRYSLEDEKHLVDYCMDCVNTDNQSRKDVRQVQAECYRVYKEKEPFSFARKAAWQSRIIVPRPYNTVQFAAAQIRKSFSPDFLSIEDPLQQLPAKFWKQVMNTQLDNRHANFVIRFVDATTMGLAVGESMDMKPRWVPGKGLQYELIEPWKICRDPDASPRDPQSGVFWIHQEWKHFYQLKAQADKGLLQNIDEGFNTNDENPDNPFMTREALAARKDQIWTRSKFMKMGRVFEFWGTVLSPNGELLLPRATYSVMGGRLIKAPAGVRYHTLRWPSVMFSPQPDLLQLGGRGLLDGIRTTWEAMCNLMCLHEDAMKWLVNPMTEINVDALVDPEDVKTAPGRSYLTHDSLNGQQAVRQVSRRDVTGSVLANLQYHDQNYQRGTAVSDSVQGLPGYRQDMTWRESEQNLGQAMEVFSLMGTNVELGAVQGVSAGREVVEAWAGWQDYQAMLGDEGMRKYGLSLGRDGIIQGLPRMSGAFHVSGIQKLMKDAETVATLVRTIIPMTNDPAYGPYIMPYNVLQALERRTGLQDENIFLSKEVGDKLQQLRINMMLAPPQPDGQGEGGGNAA
jgi:hypothetical protein